MGNRGGYPQQFNMTVPVTPAVRWLIGICVVVWLVLQLIVEGYVLGNSTITWTLGLVPENVISKFFIWEFLTYMFLHSRNVFHIVFNMLLLWWLGSELEQRWGSKFFTIYYLVSGVGAAILYTLVVLCHGLIMGKSAALWTTPVVGASGAIFGLMLAYGIIFGERIVYFMMVFPMRAKYFTMILGAVEVVTILNNGIGGGEVANLAHLGGLVSGFLFLQISTRFQQRRWRNQTNRRGRGLKLVVNNDKKDGSGNDDGGGPTGPGGGAGGKGSGPKYWN